MRDFILDTQTIRYWHDTACTQHHVVVRNVLTLRKLTEPLHFKPKLLVSVVSLGEIEYGHRVTFDIDATAQMEFTKFVREQLPEPFDVSKDAVSAYGELRARLFKKYAPREKRKPKMLPEQLVDPVTAKVLGIQENDLWICAQAIAHGMVLVTNDRMTRIGEVAKNMDMPLVLQNWAQPNVATIHV